MALVNKQDPKKVFASQAPSQDEPAGFNNYERGWDESRKNNGKPTIKQFNKLQQLTDEKILWIHQNGAALPFDETMEYAEGAVVVKDGVLQQWKGGSWQTVKQKGVGELYQEGESYNIGDEVRLANGDRVRSNIPNNTNNPNINMTGWVNPKDNLIHTVATLSDLALRVGKNGDVVYVLRNQKRYIYNNALTAADNGVTVIGKWEMEIQEAYYASWFCQAESGVDESVKLQTGSDYAVSKKRAFIIDIKVDVDPVRVGDNKVGLWVRSNSVLGFVGGGEIRMLTNNSTHYDVIRVQDVENYIINNPVLRGDRRTHTGTGGEWGYGLTVYQSKNGYIHKPRIYDMWGDGLYVGRIWGLNNSTTPTNITIFEPYVEGIRRNGISFTAGDNVNIVRPYVTKVGDHDGVEGTWPKSGIDIEPEQAVGFPKSSIVNSKITSATIKNCFAGVYVYLFSSDLHHTLTFDGVTTLDGAFNTPLGLYHGGSNCTGLISFEHVLVKPPHYVGITHGWNGASAIKCVIDRLTVLNVSSFNIGFILRGDYTEKVLGNLFVNNITANAAVYHTFEANVGDYTIGNVFRRGANHKGNFLYYDGKALNYAPEFVFDGVQTHLEWSDTTRKYPNTIWQDPSIDTAGTTAIYLNSTGDYRVLKVGLSNTTSIVGQGCNIQGLTLLVDGVAKTKAQCKTLGGWLKFQNVKGGRTKILDSYGVWTFS